MMNGETASKIFMYSKTPCPLCKQEYRLKVNLRLHIKRNHTENEAEEFLKCYQKDD